MHNVDNVQQWGDIGSGQPKSKEMLTPNADARLEFLSHRNPANLLLDGVGWSIPQSQAQRWKRSRKIVHSQSDFNSDSLQSGDIETSSNEEEPWFWVPGKAENLGSLESFTRGGLGLAKDEQPWELNAVILHSFRVHSGAMRTIAVMEDENTVFTGGGGGSRGGSVVRQWKLGTSECCMEYSGHQEVSSTSSKHVFALSRSYIRNSLLCALLFAQLQTALSISIVIIFNFCEHPHSEC